MGLGIGEAAAAIHHFEDERPGDAVPFVEPVRQQGLLDALVAHLVDLRVQLVPVLREVGIGVAELVIHLQVDVHHAARADEVRQPQQLVLVGPGIEDVGVHVGLDLVDVGQLLGRQDPAAIEVAPGLGRIGVEHVEFGAGHQVLFHDRRVVAGHGGVVDVTAHLVVVAVDVVLDDVRLVLPAAEIDRLIGGRLELRLSLGAARENAERQRARGDQEPSPHRCLLPSAWTDRRRIPQIRRPIGGYHATTERPRRFRAAGPPYSASARLRIKHRQAHAADQPRSGDRGGASPFSAPGSCRNTPRPRRSAHRSCGARPSP